MGVCERGRAAPVGQIDRRCGKELAALIMSLAEPRRTVQPVTGYSTGLHEPADRPGYRDGSMAFFLTLPLG